MTALYYTVAGIVLYVAADWVLRHFESRAGRHFEHRTLIFFLLLAVMAVASFAVIRAVFAPD